MRSNALVERSNEEGKTIFKRVPPPHMTMQALASWPVTKWVDLPGETAGGDGGVT